MDIASMVDALQEYGNYRAAKKMLQRHAYGSLFFGVMAVALGIRGPQSGALGYIILGIGAFLIFQGYTLWSLPALGPFSWRQRPSC